MLMSPCSLYSVGNTVWDVIQVLLSACIAACESNIFLHILYCNPVIAQVQTEKHDLRLLAQFGRPSMHLVDV